MIRTVMVVLRDGRRHKACVVGLLTAARAELDVCLLETAQLGGRDGRRGSGWDPRLEAFEVRQL